MPSFENVHECDDLLQKKKYSLSLENFGLLEEFSHFKYSTNATSPKFVVGKQISSKFVSKHLVLQNCFKSLSGDDQNT